MAIGSELCCRRSDRGSVLLDETKKPQTESVSLGTYNFDLGPSDSPFALIALKQGNGHGENAKNLCFRWVLNIALTVNLNADGWLRPSITIGRP